MAKAPLVVPGAEPESPMVTVAEPPTVAATGDNARRGSATPDWARIVVYATWQAKAKANARPPATKR